MRSGQFVIQSFCVSYVLVTLFSAVFALWLVNKQKKYVLSTRRSVAMLTPKLVVNVNMSIMDLYSAESRSISTALSL